MTDRGMPSRSAPEPPLPDELYSRVRAAIAAAPAPKTSTSQRVTIALAVVPLATLAFLLIASRFLFDRPALRIDMVDRPTSQLLLELLLVAGLTLTATLVAVGRGERGLGYGVASLLAAALLVAPIYAALALSPLAAREGMALLMADLSRWGLRCLTLASAVGLLALIAFTSALRRSSPVASRLRGAALGAASGAWAGLSVFLFCPATEARHLLVGHVLPVVAFTILGLALSPRALRP